MTEFYELHEPATAQEALPFASFLLNAGREHRKVAISYREGEREEGMVAYLSFSDGRDVWTVETTTPATAVMLANFRQQVLEVPQVEFVARDLCDELVNLCDFLSIELEMTTRELYYKLAPLFVGCLNSAERSSGWTASPASIFTDYAMEAYDTGVQEERFALGAPRLYQQVLIPCQKLFAEATLWDCYWEDESQKTPRWAIRYDHLWLRAAAHYTSDPTLLRMFENGRDPMPYIASLLETNPTAAQALLVWQIYSQDIDAMNKRFPETVAQLPENLPAWKLKLEKTLPAFCATLSSIGQTYWAERTIKTRYGRLLRPGKSLGEASAFVVFGTVEDFISNLCASLWLNRTDPNIFVTDVEGSPSSETLIIRGAMTHANKQQWLHMLKEIAPMRGAWWHGSGLVPVITEE